MAGKKYILLYPFSLAWGVVTWFRNFLFNTGIIKGRVFRIPIICVGNITVGGTGKTPHCEYLINLLKKDFNVALLSRGYMRRSKGFVMAAPSSDTSDIGDEPMQVWLKNPDITVAADRDRVHGIETILQLKPDTGVIILDDGFQHRQVIPGLSILLTDFNRLIIHDHLLPYGELRESKKNICRADIIIVTKCPPNLTPIQRRIIVKDIKKAPWQHLYFTTYKYGDPQPVFPAITEKTEPFLMADANKTGALLVTGIASPGPLQNHAEKIFSHIKHLPFPDHHRYSEKDIATIATEFESFSSEGKIIITTEKDAVRLKEMINIVPPSLRSAFFFIPVCIEFLNDDRGEFDNLIISYVRKNKRNNGISQKQGLR